MRWIVCLLLLCGSLHAAEPTRIVDPDDTVKLPKERIVATGCVERLLRATVLRPQRQRSNVACCERCNLPWTDAKNHVTWYWERNVTLPVTDAAARVTRKGFSALCEDCFDELTPKARWSYYQDLCRENKTPAGETEQIKAAVLEGK